jgi:hypothetical protein
MAGENLKIALPSNQFVERTRPYKKDGMVVNDAITGRQEARRRFRKVLGKKENMDVFMQQWDCEDLTVWNGATAQAEADGEAEDEDSDGEAKMRIPMVKLKRVTQQTIRVTRRNAPTPLMLPPQSNCP